MSNRKNLRTSQKYEMAMSKQLIQKRKLKKRATKQIGSTINNRAILDSDVELICTSNQIRRSVRNRTNSADSDSTITYDLTPFPHISTYEETSFIPSTSGNTHRSAETIDLTESKLSLTSFEIKPVKEDNLSKTVEKANNFLQIECPICKESIDYNNVGSTNCGHIYCMTCIEKSIKFKRVCPMCYKRLTNEGYHRIYL